MDEVIERRVLRRLGRRFDKKCGASGIPDDAKCTKGWGHEEPIVISVPKGTHAELDKQERLGQQISIEKAANAAKKKKSKLGRNILIGLGTYVALSAISNHVANKVEEAAEDAAAKEIQRELGVSDHIARKAYRELKETARYLGHDAAKRQYAQWVREAQRAQGAQRQGAQRQGENTKAGKTWHETLGVSPNATPAEIKTAYRKKAREVHPDLNQGVDKGSGEVNEAWEIAQKLGKYKRGDAMDALLQAYEMGMRVAQRRVRRDAAPVTIPPSLHPQIAHTLKTVYGNGVLGVSNSKINQDGQIEGVFVGRSRPHESAKVYSYGIDLVKQNVRFKRAATRDSEDEDCCGGKKKGCGCHACKPA